MGIYKNIYIYTSIEVRLSFDLLMQVPLWMTLGLILI